MSQLDGTLLGQPNEDDPNMVEIRLIALSEEYVHARTDEARRELSYEYRRLHRRWLLLKKGTP